MTSHFLPDFDSEADYRDVLNHFPNHGQRPIIGITANFGDKGAELADGYYKSIETAGGIPLIIPPTDNFSLLLSLLDRIDGLLLSGGADLNPLFLGEEPSAALGNVNPKRDRCELFLIRTAYDRQIPIFGICRGLQLLVAALGGTLHQDIDTEITDRTPIQHNQKAPRTMASHTVEAEKNSIVAQILGERFAVNSFHHQAVADAGQKLCVTARSTDGIIEAVESNERKSIIGVQWHPECFILENNRCMVPLFRWFVEECETFRRATEIHRQVISLDSHVDTAEYIDKGCNLEIRQENAQVDVHKLYEGKLDVVFMAAYLKQEARDDASLQQAKEKADRLLSGVKNFAEQNRNLQLALTPRDLFRAKSLNKKAIVPAIENGYAIGKDLSLLAHYKDMGVSYITLCHNGDNDICDSACNSRHEWGGLSDFGRKVVKEMNRLGIIIDLSHAGERTFYDVLDESKAPVVCTHSCCRSLCNHERNLSDAQLYALARKGGVVQITMYDGFLVNEGKATLDDFIEHLVYAIEIAGIDHVGIGTDFDGGGGVIGCNNASELINITRRLIEKGFHITDIKKIWGGNFIRVMSQVQYKGRINWMENQSDDY